MARLVRRGWRAGPGIPLEHLSIPDLEPVAVKPIAHRDNFPLGELDAIYGTFVFLLQLLRLVYELQIIGIVRAGAKWLQLLGYSLIYRPGKGGAELFQPIQEHRMERCFSTIIFCCLLEASSFVLPQCCFSPSPLPYRGSEQRSRLKSAYKPSFLKKDRMGGAIALPTCQHGCDCPKWAACDLYPQEALDHLGQLHGAVGFRSVMSRKESS